MNGGWGACGARGGVVQVDSSRLDGPSRMPGAACADRVLPSRSRRRAAPPRRCMLPPAGPMQAVCAHCSARNRCCFPAPPAPLCSQQLPQPNPRLTVFPAPAPQLHRLAPANQGIGSSSGCATGGAAAPRRSFGGARGRKGGPAGAVCRDRTAGRCAGALRRPQACPARRRRRPLPLPPPPVTPSTAPPLLAAARWPSGRTMTTS